MTTPHFILNPSSSAGKTGRSQGAFLKIIEETFPEGFTLDVTTQVGHATEIARKAIDDGSQLIVAVGGDGTMNEVINGFFDKKKLRNPKAKLGLICSGTAQDVVRNLGLPRSLREQIRALKGMSGRRIDLGQVQFADASGNRHDRWFINECHPGIAATVVQTVTPGLKKLGGFLAFGLASTYTAMTYRASDMKITLDDMKTIEGRFLGVVIANGRFAGGGMDFAPRALVDDGLLDVVLIKDQPILSRLLNFPKIYSGSHIELSWITYTQARRVRVESSSQVALEADGELLGYLPCEAEIVPGALTLSSRPL